MGNLWSIATFVGPILLGGVILWALFRNRQHNTPREVARTEAATHRLYDQQDAEDHARDSQPER